MSETLTVTVEQAANDVLLLMQKGNDAQAFFNPTTLTMFIDAIKSLIALCGSKDAAQIKADAVDAENPGLFGGGLFAFLTVKRHLVLQVDKQDRNKAVRKHAAKIAKTLISYTASKSVKEIEFVMTDGFRLLKEEAETAENGE